MKLKKGKNEQYVIIGTVLTFILMTFFIINPSSISNFRLNSALSLSNWRNIMIFELVLSVLGLIITSILGYLFIFKFIPNQIKKKFILKKHFPAIFGSITFILIFAVISFNFLNISKDLYYGEKKYTGSCKISYLNPRKSIYNSYFIHLDNGSRIETSYTAWKELGGEMYSTKGSANCNREISIYYLPFSKLHIISKN